jgi:hypothetical protein
VKRSDTLCAGLQVLGPALQFNLYFDLTAPLLRSAELLDEVLAADFTRLRFLSSKVGGDGKITGEPEVSRLFLGCCELFG